MIQKTQGHRPWKATVTSLECIMSIKSKMGMFII